MYLHDEGNCPLTTRLEIDRFQNLHDFFYLFSSQNYCKPSPLSTLFLEVKKIYILTA